MEEIRKLLAEFYSVMEAEQWLVSPQQAFAGKTTHPAAIGRSGDAN